MIMLKKLDAKKKQLKNKNYYALINSIIKIFLIN